MHGDQGCPSGEQLHTRNKDEVPKTFRPRLEAVGKRKCRFLKDHYEIRRQIGEGTYGQVFTAIHNESGEEVALKRIRMGSEKDGFPITAVREIKILKSADHENVIRLREIVRSSRIPLPRESEMRLARTVAEGNAPAGSKCGVYMVFDFMEHDLTGYCEQMKFNLPLGEVRFPDEAHELLKGLNACHENGILHRDLKLSNLLISKHGELKIADFGLARPYQEFPDSRMTTRVITLWYRPPELMLGADSYGTAIDMWSVGCIFAELLAGKALFPGKDEIDQLDRIFTMLGAPSERTMPGCSKLLGFSRIKLDRYPSPKIDEWIRHHKVDPAARDLLKSLLSLDANKRPTAAEALKHPFFHMGPKPCHPEKLKYMPPSHEFTVKKKRNEVNQQQQAPQRQNHRHDHHGSGYGDHRGYNRYNGNYYDQRKFQRRVR